MSPALLSVRRPIFIASIVILLLSLGLIALKRLPIDLYPDVNFPTVLVMTTYEGAGPQEVENEITRVLEDQVAAISGVQKVSSQNREGVSIITAEFDLKTNLDFAEQQVRAKVSNALKLLPDDVSPPVIRRLSPSDAPILSVALQADMPDAKLYDLAKEVVSPQFEAVYQVGQVDILGGRRREIHVNLDRDRLNQADISGTAVPLALKSGGRNIPAGKVNAGKQEFTFRTFAEFKTIQEIENTSLRLASVSYPITIASVGSIEDSLEDETTRTRINGQKAILFNLFRQSGANSVRVADKLKEKMELVNKDFEKQGIKAKMMVVNDLTRRIRLNVEDVQESILFGIILTIIVVYFFLGSLKSTLITGFALPNSLLGACIFMLYFDFSINIMSLLAMSLVVGLLVDDAIVVRENIFRRLEDGMSPKNAAVIGTNQVTLAVVATTLTILAVFGPIGNLQGIVGQFFKQFGLTVCFAMTVSLFDGLFVAPAMSAYVGGAAGDRHVVPKNRVLRWNWQMLQAFDRFQTWLEKKYTSLLRLCLRRPLATIVTAIGVFIFSIFIAKHVPFTFLPPQDNGEFFVQYELNAGDSLDATDEVAAKIETELRKLPEIKNLLTTIGSGQGEPHKGNIYVRLVDSKERKVNTTQMKEIVKKALAAYTTPYKVIVTDQSSAGGQRSFNLNITGQDFETLAPFADKVLAAVKAHKALQQADTSYRTGKPEFQVSIRPDVAKISGVTLTGIGEELRTLISGQTPAVFREKGVDYNVRVRLKESQRDLRQQFPYIKVPNLLNRQVPLQNVAVMKEVQGPTTILRENRTRYIQISADLVPGGGGIGGAMQDFKKMFEGELKPPPGVSFSFVGEAERFTELMTNMLVSLG
ncbi:MAG: efflux RND transporter permease subunit, partial [Bdellovibrionota bacterium]